MMDMNGSTYRAKGWLSEKIPLAQVAECATDLEASQLSLVTTTVSHSPLLLYRGSHFYPLSPEISDGMLIWHRYRDIGYEAHGEASYEVSVG